MKISLEQKLQQMQERFQEVSCLLSEASVISDQEQFKNLSKEVKKGKARHIAGEAYRRLMKGQHKNASYLFIQAINEHIKVIYFLGSIIALLPIPSIVYRKLRYFFKNYF